MFSSWLAGFFDGEGSVSLSNKRSLGTIKVSLGQKNWPLLEEIRCTYGGKLYPQTGKLSSALNWNWALTKSSEVLRFLEDIHPYLILKREEVGIAIEMCKLVGKCCTQRDKVHRLKLQEAFLHSQDIRMNEFTIEGGDMHDNQHQPGEAIPGLST